MVNRSCPTLHDHDDDDGDNDVDGRHRLLQRLGTKLGCQRLENLEIIARI